MVPITGFPTPVFGSVSFLCVLLYMPGGSGFSGVVKNLYSVSSSTLKLFGMGGSTAALHLNIGCSLRQTAIQFICYCS